MSQQHVGTDPWDGRANLARRVPRPTGGLGAGIGVLFHDLQELSTLVGESDDLANSITYGDCGSRTSQRSVHRVAVMPPQVIRTLPHSSSLVLLRIAPPIIPACTSGLRARMPRGYEPTARLLRSSFSETRRSSSRTGHFVPNPRTHNQP